MHILLWGYWCKVSNFIFCLFFFLFYYYKVSYLLGLLIHYSLTTDVNILEKIGFLLYVHSLWREWSLVKLIGLLRLNKQW